MSQELKAYIEKSLGKGRSKGEIRERLTQAGWSVKVADRLLEQYVGTDADHLAIPAPRLGSHHIARDLFLYLLSLVTLSLSALGAGGLLFQLIEHLYPETDRYMNASGTSWHIAQLVIAFPLFTWVTLLIGKDLKTHSEKRESLIRKLMIYLILVLSAIISIGDLTAVLFNFLEGDITIRFMLKALVVFGISLLIFSYYMYEVQRDDVLVRETSA